MDKKQLTEADIRSKFITPAIVGRWDLMTQVLEERYFTKGRVIVRGNSINLDLKNPHNPDTGPGDVDHLLPQYEKLLAQIAQTRAQLKAQLMEALTR